MNFTKACSSGDKNKLHVKAKKISRNDIKYQIQHVNLQYKMQALFCLFIFIFYKEKIQVQNTWLIKTKIIFFAVKQSSGKILQHH